jgi:triosephosphate isomerase
MAIIASNFKTNHTRKSTALFINEVDDYLVKNSIQNEVYVFPTATSLDSFDTVPNLNIGVQNAYSVNSGSFTGEIGTEQIDEFGIKTILIGHSERRHILGETQAQIAAKYEFYKNLGYKIIYCIGEPLVVKNFGLKKTLEYIYEQFIGIDTNYDNLILASETTLQQIEDVDSPIEVEDVEAADTDEKITLEVETNEEPKVTIQATPEKTLDKVEEEVIELPRPKTTASKTAAVITKTELPLPAISLANITLEELVQRKHNFNITNAGGDLLEVIQFLDRYQDKMRAGLEVPPEQGESLQKQLYKIYLRILSLDSTKERDVALEILLWKFYKDEKGAFKVTQLGRFTRNGRWIIQELNMFLQLNHIFNSVKNPQERIVRLKQFKLSAIISPTLQYFFISSDRVLKKESKFLLDSSKFSGFISIKSVLRFRVLKEFCISCNNCKNSLPDCDQFKIELD